MKQDRAQRRLGLVLLLFLGVLAARAPASARQAPPFPSSLPWYNVTRALTWHDLRGRAVLLDFFTPGCINCIHMLPVEELLQRHFGKRLVIIAVDSPKFSASASAPGLIAFIRRYRLQHPVLLDPRNRLWDAYHIFAWPTFILIGPHGELRARLLGEQSAAALSVPIAAALAGTPPISALQPLPRQGGTAANLALAAPGGLAVSRRRVAIADTGHNRIILADHQGRVEAVIGTGCAGTANGGYAQAEFRRPHGLDFHADKLYVADTENQLIRIIHLNTRRVSTLAGNGKREYIVSGKFTPHAVPLDSPWDVQWIGNQLYIAMAGDHEIWRYNPVTGRLGPWAGSGREGLADGSLARAKFAQTSGLSSHGDTLYALDPESSGIRSINLADPIVKTRIGQGLFRFGERNGAAAQALLQHPEALAWLNGSLYIADTFNNALRRLNLASAEVTTVTQNLGQPQAIAVLSPSTLLVAESSAGRIAAIRLPSEKTDPWPLSGLPPSHCKKVTP